MGDSSYKAAGRIRQHRQARIASAVSTTNQATVADRHHCTSQSSIIILRKGLKEAERNEKTEWVNLLMMRGIFLCTSPTQEADGADISVCSY